MGRFKVSAGLPYVWVYQCGAGVRALFCWKGDSVHSVMFLTSGRPAVFWGHDLPAKSALQNSRSEGRTFRFGRCGRT
jgi:hypothetical protein